MEFGFFPDHIKNYVQKVLEMDDKNIIKKLLLQPVVGMMKKEFYFNFYNPQAYENIYKKSHEIMNDVCEYLKENKFEVVYSFTDSLHVKNCEGKSEAPSASFSVDICSFVNAYLKEIKGYKFLSVKKTFLEKVRYFNYRYMGILNGKFFQKGLINKNS